MSAFDVFDQRLSDAVLGVFGEPFDCLIEGQAPYEVSGIYTESHSVFTSDGEFSGTVSAIELRESHDVASGAVLTRAKDGSKWRLGRQLDSDGEMVVRQLSPYFGVSDGECFE